MNALTSPVPPSPGVGEFITTAGWYRQHGEGWEWQEWDTWHEISIPPLISDSAPILVRRVDSEES